jgi:hypothetical protein
LAAHSTPSRSGEGYARLLAIADGLVPQNKVAIASKLSPFRGRQGSIPDWANQAL